MAKSQKKKNKGPSRTKVIASVAAAVAVVAIGGGALYVYQSDSATKAADAKFVAEQKEAQTSVTDSVEAVLDSDAGVARVYDTSDSLLFTVRQSNGVAGVGSLPSTFAEALQAKLLNGHELSVVNLDDWSASHTIFGGGGKSESTLDFSSGSLGFSAVSCYCELEGISMSDETKLVVAAYLDSAYTAEELLRYCASAGSYGGVSGVVTAVEQWFNKGLDELSSNQLSYLVYAFNNTEASWDDFKKNNPDLTDGAETAEDFGFSQVGGDRYWLLKERVAEELSDIVGDDLKSNDYTVKLEIDAALQGKLQEALDSGLKTSITLGADGQTVLDGTVGVVNPSTGFIVALVGGRSVNTVAREFKLNTASLIGDYVAAGEEFAKDASLSYATLMPYETSAGTTDYAPLYSLVVNDQLSLINVTPTIETTCTLDELLNFGTSLYTDTEPRLVRQVLDDNGAVIYTAAPATDTSNTTPNPDLRALLNGDVAGTKCNYLQDSEVGSVLGLFTSEYVVGTLVGTNTTGYTMEYSDLDLSATTALTLSKLVGEYYPRTPEQIDATGAVYKKVLDSFNSNSTVVSDAVDAWVAELEGLEINSVGTRSTFESLYLQYASQLQGYAGLVSSDLLAELQGKLDAIRIARSSDLLKFAA